MTPVSSSQQSPMVKVIRRRRGDGNSTPVSVAGTEYALDSNATESGFKSNSLEPDKISPEMICHLRTVAEWLVANSKLNGSKGELLSTQSYSGYLSNPDFILLHDYILSNTKKDSKYDPHEEVEKEGSGLRNWLRSHNME